VENRKCFVSLINLNNYKQPGNAQSREVNIHNNADLIGLFRSMGQSSGVRQEIELSALALKKQKRARTS